MEPAGHNNLVLQFAGASFIINYEDTQLTETGVSLCRKTYRKCIVRDKPTVWAAW